MNIKKEMLDLEIKLHDIRIELKSVDEIKKQLAGICKDIAKLRENIK